MLVLAREKGESIIIGGLVEVVVVGYKYKGNKITGVKLGVIAPKEVTVNRKEVEQRIDDSKN